MTNDSHECECGKPISENTAHVPCVDCGGHVMVDTSIGEESRSWRCGICGRTAVATVSTEQP